MQFYNLIFNISGPDLLFPFFIPIFRNYLMWIPTQNHPTKINWQFCEKLKSFLLRTQEYVGMDQSLKYWELKVLKNFFELTIMEKKIFCFIPMKISQSFLCSQDGSKFWWLPWFPAQNNTCSKICNTVYVI